MNQHTITLLQGEENLFFLLSPVATWFAIAWDEVPDLIDNLQTAMREYEEQMTAPSTEVAEAEQ